MTRAERSRLIDLLGKQLLEAHRLQKNALFHHSWKTLWAMGAQVLVNEDGSFLVISSK